MEGSVIASTHRQPFSGEHVAAATIEVARDVVAHLVQAGVDEVESAVGETLARLGRHLGVDRTYVFRREGETVSNTHEWCAPGVTPEIDNLAEVPIEVIEHWRSPLDAGRAIHVADVADLPPDRAMERDVLADQGIRSLLVVPLTSLGAWWGFVGFDAVDTPRCFGPTEQIILRSVADVLTATLVNAESAARAAASEARLRVLTANAAELVTIVADGLIRYASPSWARVGVDPDELLGAPLTQLFRPDDAELLARLVDDAGTAVDDEVPRPSRVQLPDVRLSGDRYRWLRGAMTDLRHEPEVAGLVLSQHEVTEQLLAEERLRHIASHDALTGLPNRVALRASLEAACGDRSGEPAPISVMMLDLDGFKFVNDSLGHDAGDALLVEVAARLHTAVAGRGTVSRFGGDEFVVLHEGGEAERDALIADLVDCFEQPFVVRGRHHRITASIGVAPCRETGRRPTTLIGDADLAMFSAKSEGRNRVVHFDGDFRAGVVRRHAIVDRLPLAIDRGEVEAHHQPLVDLATGEVVGHEALARWSDDVLGPVAPGEFIPAAEQVGLIDRLGARMLRDSLAAASLWPAEQYTSVNLSVTQLHHQRLVADVEQALLRAGVPASRLVVEVTESRVMHHPERAIAALSDLRALGVRVAMDDFGTGQSSLALLHGLPLDILKIDMAFIRSVDTDRRARSMVAAILGICHELGLVSVAEGVEQPPQREILAELGCSIGQGWLFGRAVARAVPVRV